MHWSRSFHPQSLEICINLRGKGVVECDGKKLEVSPATTAFYSSGDTYIHAERRQGTERHSFLTIELSLESLKELLPVDPSHLHPIVATAFRGGRFESGLGNSRNLLVDRERWVMQLLNPPVSQAAERIWVRGRVHELLAECLFGTDGNRELFCDRQKQVARSRSERVVEILRSNLETPPNLRELGKLVGCSPFYLSRTFSKETGKTIPQYLRRLRIERAADLLASGRTNVTEAAIEVGYNSMSHFSQAFCHEMGVCPALYTRKA